MTTPLPLKDVDVGGERLARLNEAETEPVGGELDLRGPIRRFVSEA